MAESAYSRVISNWNKASTCKLSVTMTRDLLLEQSSASSEQFFLINFTHKPWAICIMIFKHFPMMPNIRIVSPDWYYEEFLDKQTMVGTLTLATAFL